jgi:glycosyltransferase involved in cell wall biosynthesis
LHVYFKHFRQAKIQYTLSLVNTSFSVGIPVLNDEKSIEEIVLKTTQLLEGNCRAFEIIIINDGSTDRTGEIIGALALKHQFVKVIHHSINKGYGFTINELIQNSQHEWICLIDGDGEFDIYDLKKFIPLLPHYEMINSFRYIKQYSRYRKFMSFVFKKALWYFFEAKFRDISSGLRILKREVVRDIIFTSSSPFIGAEIAIKVSVKGYRIGELGIQTFPKHFGVSYSTTPVNIFKTIEDMRSVYTEIFSSHYGVPDNHPHF